MDREQIYIEFTSGNLPPDAPYTPFLSDLHGAFRNQLRGGRWIVTGKQYIFVLYPY